MWPNVHKNCEQQNLPFKQDFLKKLGQVNLNTSNGQTLLDRIVQLKQLIWGI